MKLKRTHIILSTLFALCLQAGAQSGLNSPYTRYGLGRLSDGVMGANKAMGGTGYALRSNSYINLMNPAAISAVDSLTFMLDAGFTLQNTNFAEKGIKMNKQNSTFDYIALQFRLRKGVGFSLGLLPYSTVGYSFSTTSQYSYPDETSFTAQNSFGGDGGLRTVQAGVGWEIVPNLSVGASLGYLYGDITHSIVQTFSESSIHSRNRVYSTTISSYKADLGLQLALPLKNEQQLTLGLTYSPGHKMNGDAKQIDQSLASSTLAGSDTLVAKDAFELPHSIGVGVAYCPNARWTVAADYTLQLWDKARFFNNQQGCNRNKIAVGAQYAPNDLTSHNLLKRMRYRAGAYYSDPYTLNEGEKATREYGITAGLSIPVLNRYNNRSWLNVSGEYVRVEPTSSGMITETYLRLNVGISFNENWFSKRKVR